MTLTFSQLIELYENTSFEDDKVTGKIALKNWSICELINQISNGTIDTDTSGITILDVKSTFNINDSVNVEIGSPKTSIGHLAKDAEHFLNFSKAKYKEPKSYYILDGKHSSESERPTDFQKKYRKAINFIEILIQSASFFDETREDIIFIGKSKIIIPLNYTPETINRIKIEQLDDFIKIFTDQIHLDQKYSILSISVQRLTASSPQSERLANLFRNIETLIEDVHNGYKLFASSFSYSKIKNELETAKIDLLSKIHKTLVDIQGQLLGIPVAAIIVASQLKAVSQCKPEYWGNLAILFGAWVFVALLFIAIINQLATLHSISTEITRQQNNLKRDYASLGDEFTDVFSGLHLRICFHKLALIAIGFISLAGAVATTYAFNSVTAVSISSCIN